MTAYLQAIATASSDNFSSVSIAIHPTVQQANLNTKLMQCETQRIVKVRFNVQYSRFSKLRDKLLTAGRETWVGLSVLGKCLSTLVMDHTLV
jgi:hypothetical protein